MLYVFKVRAFSRNKVRLKSKVILKETKKNDDVTSSILLRILRSDKLSVQKCSRATGALNFQVIEIRKFSYH